MSFVPRGGCSFSYLSAMLPQNEHHPELIDRSGARSLSLSHPHNLSTVQKLAGNRGIAKLAGAVITLPCALYGRIVRSAGNWNLRVDCTCAATLHPGNFPATNLDRLFLAAGDRSILSIAVQFFLFHFYFKKYFCKFYFNIVNKSFYFNIVNK